MGRALVVRADGGSRGNPGPAGYGALVADASTGEVLAEVAEAIGAATNNVAEYRGLIAGLRAAVAIDPGASVEVAMDSKLVVEQMSGRWKVKHPDMAVLAREARTVLPAGAVTYRWVPRAQNSHADRLANEAMDAAAAGRPWRAHAGAGGTTAATGSVGDGVATPTMPVPARPGDGASRRGDLEPTRAWELLAVDPRAVLVDVRTAPELTFVGLPDLSGIGKRVVTVEWSRYPGGHNAGFLDEIAAIERDAPVLFLCRSGVRSAAAADAAAAAGWTSAYNVADGFEGHLDEAGHRGAQGWRAAGLPWRQG